MRTRLICGTLLFCSLSWGQSVLAPYVAEHRQPDSIINFYPTVDFIFPELADSASLAKLKAKGDEYSAYGAKAPLKLKDFTYFNDNLRNFQQYKDETSISRFGFLNIFFRAGGRLSGRTEYPPSLLFYGDTSSIRVKESTGEITTTEKPILEKYIEPFYFKNYEVTNKEYREFVFWVRDSIARQLLANAGVERFMLLEEDWFQQQPIRIGNYYPSPPPLNWKKKIPWDTDDEEFRAILEEMYLTEQERFYRRREIDVRKLNYWWYDTLGRSDKYSIKKVINVYPDTLTWVHDFVYAFNEPLTNYYFWHPAYDHYPVVGLTYRQVQAFLNWKTKMMQQELDNKGIKLRVQCKLPSEVEWDIVSTAVQAHDSVKTFTYNSEQLWDQSWITDLQFLERKGADTLVHKNDANALNIIKRNRVKTDDLLLKDEKFKNDFSADGYFHTSEADLRKVDQKKRVPQLMLNLDKVGISGMGANVSEWMEDTLEGSWQVLFRIRQQLLQKSGFPEAKLVAGVEQFYFALRSDSVYPGATRHLVRGANWFDERSSFKWEKNTAGMSAKNFVSDQTARCTIGFRYIVKVYPK